MVALGRLRRVQLYHYRREGTPLPDPATVTVNKKDAKDGIAAINFGKIRYTLPEPTNMRSARTRATRRA